jgi:Matrixin
LVQALKNGIIVGGINVPASGYSEGNALLTISGEYELTAVNYNGILTVRQFQESNPPRTAITSAPVACSQTNYNYEGSQWNATDKWYYNESTAGESGLGVSSTLSDIRSAINNMTNGVNDCGYSGEFAAGGSFQGDTSLFANINSSAMCTSNFPDGQSTVGWQYFNPALTFALADTCWYSFAGHMEEADIAFAPNVGFVDQLPNNCTSSYDLQSAATHEWGHVFGLAHASGWAETMYSQSSLCHTYERTLGNGDWTAMANLYGFR